MKKTSSLWVSWALLAVGVLLTAVGLLLGGADSVLSKATRVCMECVGIG